MSDHTLPDPDAIEVRIGCERDSEAEECDPVCVRCPYYNTPWSCNGGTDEHPCPNGADDPEAALAAANVAMGVTTKPADTDTFRGTCPTCGGRGWCITIGDTGSYPCPTCHGTGVK